MTNFATTDLPDAVVNQRAHVGVYATAPGDRTGEMGVSVYLDRESSDEIPFLANSEAFRGWNGGGLSSDECRYVAGLLYSAALFFAEKVDEVPDADA